MGKNGKCLIADDHPILRKGIRDLLLCSHIFSQAIEVANAREALSAVRRESWDLVILDVSLPDKHGLEVLKEIKLLKPKLPVLMLSLYPEREFALRALKAGAAGYLTKDRAPSELLKAVKQIVAGRRYITSTLADQMAALIGTGQSMAPRDRLSNREIEVLRLLGQGHTVSMIGNDIALSVKTISTYRARLLEKLHLRTTADLVRYAVEQHLTD